MGSKDEKEMRPLPINILDAVGRTKIALLNSHDTKNKGHSLIQMYSSHRDLRSKEMH